MFDDGCSQRIRKMRVGVSAIDIHADDVPSATRLLSQAYGWRVISDGADFGELDAGAELLRNPVRTDWESEAAYLRGPGHLIVDVCRDV